MCRPSIANASFSLVVYSIAYMITSFWDGYSIMYPPQTDKLESVSLVVTSAVDAVIYFAIFQNLMNTMDELTEKRQDAKLEIFTKLRNLLLVSVVISTVTLLLFSYIVLKDLSHSLWRYQWIMNDGIWTVYYFVLFVAIMIMWKPSENSSAYAVHIQVPTTEDVSM